MTEGGLKKDFVRVSGLGNEHQFFVEDILAVWVVLRIANYPNSPPPVQRSRGLLDSLMLGVMPLARDLKQGRLCLSESLHSFVLTGTLYRIVAGNHTGFVATAVHTFIILNKFGHCVGLQNIPGFGQWA